MYKKKKNETKKNPPPPHKKKKKPNNKQRTALVNKAFALQFNIRVVTYQYLGNKAKNSRFYGKKLICQNDLVNNK